MTRRLGTDCEDPQCGACAGRPVQEPGGQMVCPAGSGRGRARDGNTPRRGQEQCGLALRPTGDGGHAGRLAVASAVGAGHRLLAGAWRLSLSRSYTGYHRAWLPAGKPGPAGGALMSGAMAGRNTPAGGGPVGAALRARSCGRRQSCRPRDRAARAGVRLPEPPAAGQARLTGSPAVVVRAVTRRAWRA